MNQLLEGVVVNGMVPKADAQRAERLARNHCWNVFCEQVAGSSSAVPSDTFNADSRLL